MDYLLIKFTKILIYLVGLNILITTFFVSIKNEFHKTNQPNNIYLNLKKTK